MPKAHCNIGKKAESTKIADNYFKIHYIPKKSEFISEILYNDHKALITEVII